MRNFSTAFDGNEKAIVYKLLFPKGAFLISAAYLRNATATPK
ncbi:hypothetical protein AVP43_00604 [Geobacillus stearothermophilus]|nr:hypothetical protein AVP43_00604 [Geobacillus stearothermophilus]